VTADRARGAGVNRAIVALCRGLGQPPSYWRSLSTADRALLLGEFSTRTGG